MASTLTLKIENQTSLPDGGPLSIAVAGKRGIDIGRDQHLDWCLPDPTRFVSGKHCEVRFSDGDYLLTDVSSNGTFLNGSQNRMQSPHRLRDGDRLLIGQYIVRAEIAGASLFAEPPNVATRAQSYEQLWDSGEEAPPPINPNDLKPPKSFRPTHGDFLEKVMEAPGGSDVNSLFETHERYAPPAAAAKAAGGDFDWAPVVAKAAPPVEPPSVAPTPRRAAAPAPASHWGDDEGAAPPPVPELPRPVAAAEPVRAPQPVRGQEPVAERPASPRESAGGDDFLQRFAAGAGLPAHVLAHRDAGAFAEELGSLMRVVTADLKQLLTARVEAKRLSRSSSHTMIAALDNNPLKFTATPEDALKIMFGPPSKSYLDAHAAFGQGFADVKTHQVKSFAAMQEALRRMVEDFDPAKIEKATPAESGLGAMVGSRKSRLWDTYKTRWNAKTQHHADGLLSVFMLYFAECYDR